MWALGQTLISGSFLRDELVSVGPQIPMVPRPSMPIGKSCPSCLSLIYFPGVWLNVLSLNVACFGIIIFSYSLGFLFLFFVFCFNFFSLVNFQRSPLDDLRISAMDAATSRSLLS